MNERISSEDLAAQKALHSRIRNDLHASAKGSLRTTTAGFNEQVPHRIMLLIWAFARGLPYRRVEPRRRIQDLPNGSTFEHNAPALGFLQAEAEKYLPHATLDALATWLSEPPIERKPASGPKHHQPRSAAA